MAENRVEANAHNAGGCPASNAIHGHINDFLVRTGLRSGVSELQLPCFTAVRAEIALMSGWPQLSCIYLFFNFIINKLNQTSSLFNFSFMRLFLSHNPAKRAALLAV